MLFHIIIPDQKTKINKQEIFYFLFFDLCWARRTMLCVLYVHNVNGQPHIYIYVHVCLRLGN